MADLLKTPAFDKLAVAVWYQDYLKKSGLHLLKKKHKNNMTVSSGIYQSHKVAPLSWSIVDEISYHFYVSDIKSEACKAFCANIEKVLALKEVMGH